MTSEAERTVFPVAEQSGEEKVYLTDLTPGKSYAVLDTACAAACAGDAALDHHESLIPSHLKEHLNLTGDPKKYLGIEGTGIKRVGEAGNEDRGAGEAGSRLDLREVPQ